MARLCAFIFAVSGAVIGMAGAALAIIAVRGPRPDLAPVAELVRALAVLASAFVTSGAVALLLRQRAARAADSSQPSTPNV